MTVVDTSVWVAHLRASDAGLVGLLESGRDDEILAFIERRSLSGRGVGPIDVHLLASALLARAGLMTYDRRLAKLAAETVDRP